MQVGERGGCGIAVALQPAIGRCGVSLVLMITALLFHMAKEKAFACRLLLGVAQTDASIERRALRGEFRLVYVARRRIERERERESVVSHLNPQPTDRRSDDRSRDGTIIATQKRGNKINNPIATLECAPYEIFFIIFKYSNIRW